MLNNVNFKPILITFNPNIQAQKIQIKPLIMKKISLYIAALLVTSGVMAQRVMHIDDYRPRHAAIDLTDNHFIKGYEPLTTLDASERSGAVSFVELGSAYNIYTILLDEQNQVAYNPDLDAVTFIHRQNAGTAGGSGGIAFDRSLDGGATWTDNYIMTPDFNAGSTPVGGSRYPSIAIWNPAGNTNPANAFAIGTGPTLQAGAAGWGWIFATSARLSDGTTIAEDYYQQTPGANTDFHPYGLTVNPNGDIWSISTYYPEDVINDYSFYYINKGVYNTTTSQVDWTLSQTFIDPDYSIDPADGSNIGGFGWNIAFSPDGQTGYAVLLISENSSVYIGIQPVVYKTTNAGNTWTRLPDFDFRTLTTFQDILIETAEGDKIPFFTSLDVAVDANDKLNIFSNVLSRSSSLDDQYGFIWTGPGTSNLFHLTTSSGSDWTCTLVDSIVTEDGAVGAIGHPTRTNISSSADGEKIFFVWNDSDGSIVSTNDLPNLKIRGYDVSSQQYTFVRTPTAGSAVDGVIFFPVVAPTVIETGDDFDFEVPVVFAQPGADDLSPPTFFFIRGAGFNDDEFGLSAPSATADFSFVVSTTGSGVVNFTNLSIDATEYVWDFGDSGPLSGLTNPSKTYTASGVYNVCLTAKNSGSPATDDTECKEVDVLVNGLQDALLAEALTVFPSPTSGQVNVTINGQVSGEFTVQVYNLLGEEVTATQRIVAGSNALIQLDLSGLANGQYLVKVQNAGSVAMRSVSVSR
ncbi:MAG: T9SS type A sorting domain-containing protein [Bacteroidetes bacterium]|nr:T9SS type A sorting domain-containing protein [Bacteroidota bacterium]